MGPKINSPARLSLFSSTNPSESLSIKSSEIPGLSKNANHNIPGVPPPTAIASMSQEKHKFKSIS